MFTDELLEKLDKTREASSSAWHSLSRECLAGVLWRVYTSSEYFVVAHRNNESSTLDLVNPKSLVGQARTLGLFEPGMVEQLQAYVALTNEGPVL